MVGPPPSLRSLSAVYAARMSTPTDSASAFAASPMGAWSAISSSAPPERTHAVTAAHSAGVNTGFDAASADMSLSPSAFATTSTSAFRSSSTENGAAFAVTRYPSWRARSANGR
jgi:hypothetical protein